MNITETLASQVNGVIGSWPDNLFWLNAVSTQPQNISLNTGWNMVSLNVHPNSMAITDIFSGIMAYVEMIKSPEGVFIPGNPYNTLTQLTDGKGVFVKVNSSCVLSVTGIPVDLTTPIYLSAGWNLIGYILPNPMNISSALISLAGNYIQVKGVEGVFEPNNPFSTLSVLSPGRAYWIKMINPGILFYAYPLKEEQAPQNILSCAKWGTPIQKTNSQTVLCSLGNFASVGDQLAALVNGELRGLAALISNNGILGTYINIFTDSPGEIIEFQLIKKNSQEIIQLQPNLSSEPGEITGDYSNGIYYTLTQAPNQTPEIVTGLVSAYPNPFSASTSITLNVGKEKQPVQIEIYNLRGQKIITLVQDELESGQHNILWNGTDENGRRVASGVYLCKMHSKDRTQSIKLMVLK
ncbi:MAG TPA: T9SS type A sorting domain-containing protein [Candidatus Cloacimonas sp.]|nr:T9SS type A sorting domain-containing protein [Candidatus Cloacimonas sp.]